MYYYVDCLRDLYLYFLLLNINTASININDEQRGEGEGGGALPDFLSCSLFSMAVWQTASSGNGHRNTKSAAVLSTCPLHTNSSVCGEERRITLIGPR